MLPDDKIEAWMGVMLHEAKEQNKTLRQIKILLANPPGNAGVKDPLLTAIGGLGGDLAPEELIRKAAAVVEERAQETEAEQKSEATHVEHKCPACEHNHIWDLHPYTEPGSMFAEYVRSEEDREKDPQEDEPVHLTDDSIKAFVEGQICAKCGTPMTGYIDSTRATLPVIGVGDMYGLDPKNNPPETQLGRKAAAAGAVDPAVPTKPATKKKVAGATKKRYQVLKTPPAEKPPVTAKKKKTSRRRKKKR